MTIGNELKNGLFAGCWVKTSAFGVLRIFRVYRTSGIVKLVDGNGFELELTIEYVEKLEQYIPPRTAAGESDDFT